MQTVTPLFAEPEQSSIQQSLLATFNQQKNQFLLSPYPSLKRRKQQLVQLKTALLAHKDEIADTVSQDFGFRPNNETLLLEMMTTIGNINYTVDNLRRWMLPEKKEVALQFQPASNEVIYQPLGIIGIIVPWNYPLYLSVGPLVAAIAAGDRAMIKLSEFTPHFNAVLKRMLATIFSETEVAIIQGEVEVATAFSQIPFDHLFFTGSTAVGRHVMRAAAENLTPVTLELGGKSPTVIDHDINMNTVSERIMYGKCANGGQTCVAPDYILCPNTRIKECIDSLITRFNTLYPNFDTTEDYTHVINDAQYERLLSWLEEAEQQGATIISTTDKPYQAYRQQRKLPLQFVLNAPESCKLMQQEIFGPILPIIGYQQLDDAIHYIQNRPHPLALYILSFNKSFQNELLERTHSGGVGINETILHVGQEDMPFGGVGQSGMGHYHGKEGFLTFSKAKAIHRKGWFNSARFIHPPFHRSLLKPILKLFMR